MDYYKKKTLKFSSEVRREIRHAETVKARESSRFKRLSMLRCMEEDDEPSFDHPLEKVKQEVNKPVSRLEILRKWKHEQMVKKELEKKNSIRPFYAGALSLKSTNKGTSNIGKCNQSSGNNSSTSKKVDSSLKSRVPNASKQALQTSKIPNTLKQVSSYTSLQTSRIPNSSKQVFNSATLTSRIQNGSKPVGSVPKTLKNTHLQRIPSSNEELAKKPTTFGNNPKKNQVLVKSKIQTGLSSPASSLHGSGSTKGIESRIGKPSCMVSRRIPVPTKLPVANNQKPINTLSKKLPSAGIKLPALSSNQKSASGLKKPSAFSKVDVKKDGPVLQRKKAFPESTASRSNIVEPIPKENNFEPTSSADYKQEPGSEKNIESSSDIFDCDVSIIKPAPSFAPENFTFQAPTEILDLSFDYSILKKIKEFTSRTSTPSKQNVQETKSDDNDTEVTQKPSENVDIENISIPSKQPAQSSENDNDKEVIQKPSEYVYVETNTSTSSKQQVYESDIVDGDKKSLQEPSENVELELNTSIPSKQPAQSSENDKDYKEVIQKPSEYLHVETNTVTLKPGQVSESDAEDGEIMQRSSENVKNESNISSPPEDLVQDSANSSPKIQDSSSQLSCPSIAKTDEERPLKQCEDLVAETEKMILPLNGGVDREKYKESLPSNAFTKRRSILRISTLKSIAEADDILPLPFIEDAAENKENFFLTPRRSNRISKLIVIDESECSSTPRRSLRLQEKISKNKLDDSSYKGSAHTNLTNEFDQLTFEDFDSMNPDDYLCDIDDSPVRTKSKKVSLLYSPDKRKSIRRSIKGDLMSFSPNSPRV